MACGRQCGGVISHRQAVPAFLRSCCWPFVFRHLTLPPPPHLPPLLPACLPYLLVGTLVFFITFPNHALCVTGTWDQERPSPLWFTPCLPILPLPKHMPATLCPLLAFVVPLPTIPCAHLLCLDSYLCCAFPGMPYLITCPWVVWFGSHLDSASPNFIPHSHSFCALCCPVYTDLLPSDGISSSPYPMLVLAFDTALPFL